MADEGLSESNRPSIAESNRPRSVTFSMLCMWGVPNGGRVKLKEETHSSLIQTGVSSSFNLDLQLVGDR